MEPFPRPWGAVPIRLPLRAARPWPGLHGIAVCLHVAAVGPHPVIHQLVETHHKSS